MTPLDNVVRVEEVGKGQHIVFRRVHHDGGVSRLWCLHPAMCEQVHLDGHCGRVEADRPPVDNLHGRIPGARDRAWGERH